jgi:hypothetical protein
MDDFAPSTPPVSMFIESVTLSEIYFALENLPTLKRAPE